jgi:hypothetical protein
MNILKQTIASFPRSLPEFQRLSADEAACAA